MLFSAAALAQGPAAKLPLFGVLTIDRAGDAAAEDADEIANRLRDLCAELLPPDRFLVLTQENTLKVLEERGVSAMQAAEASSALETAQLGGIQDFVTGS